MDYRVVMAGGFGAPAQYSGLFTPILVEIPDLVSEHFLTKRFPARTVFRIVPGVPGTPHLPFPSPFPLLLFLLQKGIIWRSPGTPGTTRNT
jgi:hypothetical protein